MDYKTSNFLGPSQKVEPEPGPFPKIRARALKKWPGLGRSQAGPRLGPITTPVSGIIHVKNKIIHANR